MLAIEMYVPLEGHLVSRFSSTLVDPFWPLSAQFVLGPLWPVWKFKEGGEGRGVEGRRVPLYLIWMFLKLVRGNGVINPSSCLDVFKIMREMRENNLNRQIYSHLKMDLHHWSMINLLE